MHPSHEDPVQSLTQQHHGSGLGVRQKMGFVMGSNLLNGYMEAFSIRIFSNLQETGHPAIAGII